MEERIEVREGREFRVTVLPEVKSRKKAKPVRTMKEARAIKLSSGSDDIVRCSICHRPMPLGAIRRRAKRAKHQFFFCGRCCDHYGSVSKLIAQAKKGA